MLEETSAAWAVGSKISDVPAAPESSDVFGIIASAGAANTAATAATAGNRQPTAGS